MCAQGNLEAEGNSTLENVTSIRIYPRSQLAKKNGDKRLGSGSCYLVALLIERCCFPNTSSPGDDDFIQPLPIRISGIRMEKATNDQ
jgi:hypothetical protein